MGDDALTRSARERTVLERYVAVNGKHPMSEADEAYVRAHFVAATSTALSLMLEDRLPLPSYVLGDGTPMVPRDHDKILDDGGADPHAWFLSWWTAAEQTLAEQEWRTFLAGQYAGLRVPGPDAIRQKSKWSAQFDAALAVLAERPGHHVGRGSLGEATAMLEKVLLPETAYDRRRFDTAQSLWDTVQQAKAAHLSPSPPDLPLRTERLVLRRATGNDLDEMLAYYGDAGVAEHLLHPPFTRRELEDRLRRPETAEALQLVIELHGKVVGDVVLMLEGPSYDTGELGWVLNPAHAGRGIATEAARALLDLAFEHYGLHRVRAELDARNTRSAALAERLGMTKEAHLRQDSWSKGEWTDTPHYSILVDEWRATASSRTAP